MALLAKYSRVLRILALLGLFSSLTDCVERQALSAAPTGRSGAAEQDQTIEVSGFDSAAIHSALGQAQPGDTVRLPAGSYAITKAIRPKSGIRLLGAGQEKTVLRFAGEEPDVLVSIAGCEDVEISHLTLDGNKSRLVGQGIYGTDSRRINIHDVTVRNLGPARGWGPHGILFNGSNPRRENGVTDSEISDCLIENIAPDVKSAAGIRIAWGSSRNRILRNVIRNTGRGGILANDGSNDLLICENTVSGSGGEGLGIEVWGHSDRAVIEDNRIDHWLSVGGCDFCAVRRNVIADEGGPTKAYGLEIIGSYCIVTDNLVDHGQGIGISVSNKMPKNYHYYARNTIRRCYHWGAQLQGESGGIACHYYYQCKFLETLVGHPAVKYEGAEGNGFRTNGNVKHVVFEQCEFSDNGRFGLQLGGGNVDGLTFLRCAIRNNKRAAVVGPHDYSRLEWIDCTVEGNGDNKLPPAKPFAAPPPAADFTISAGPKVGEPVLCRLKWEAAEGPLSGVLWDFGEGIPVFEKHAASHTFTEPGDHRVTMIAWDDNGRGTRIEKLISVAP